jgi:murein DD-endopeptidase MepM/ murein hydrolase activator NlpD
VLCLPVAAVAGLALSAGRSAGDPYQPQAAAEAGVPARAAQAYQRSGDMCMGLDWTLLAAVGAVETRHGQLASSSIDPDSGEVTPWIFGPPLDGTNATVAIPVEQWIGWWGLTGPWLQAVGPMQFLPSTFEAHAVDVDQNGVANPHDIDDAVGTAARFICAASGGFVDGAGEVGRIYNPGDPSYADRLAEEQQRIGDAARSSSDIAAGTSATACPVAGSVTFSDAFGAPRSGGRTHEGVDMFAAAGTPVVAPANGTVEHYDNELGGLSYRLYADDGTFYYGTHLAAYENVGAGNVVAGTIIGYVGNTGNAATTPPHLHWEIHPDGRGSPAVNPTPTAAVLCAAQ